MPRRILHGLLFPLLRTSQLFHRLREALIVNCLAVPAALAFHEGNALTLDGMRQDDGGLTLDGFACSNAS